jgi:hypothetical protein
MDEDKRFEHWCIVEVMGHTTYAGFVTEQEIGGGSFIRVDVPGTSDTQPFTKLLGHGSIYCITPCDEETARAWALKTVARAFDTYRAPVLPAPETYNELLEHEEEHGFPS